MASVGPLIVLYAMSRTQCTFGCAKFGIFKVQGLLWS